MEKIVLFLFTLFRTFLAAMIGWTLVSYVVNGAAMVGQTAWFENGLVISAVVALVFAVAAILPSRRPDGGVVLPLEGVTPRKRERLKLVK